MCYNYSMKTYEVVCSTCSETFTSSRSNAKYCTPVCKPHSQSKTSTHLLDCQGCAKTVSITVRSNKELSERKYCSRSCATRSNNRNSPKRIRTSSLPTGKKFCDSCEILVSMKTENCSTCKKSKKIESWLSGQWSGASSNNPENLSKIIKLWIIQQANYSCHVCGFNERHPVDNSCIIEVDHIDGNSSNHDKDNLVALCPNHHALTPTYRGRNRGKGRSKRYKTS